MSTYNSKRNRRVRKRTSKGNSKTSHRGRRVRTTASQIWATAKEAPASASTHFSASSQSLIDLMEQLDVDKKYDKLELLVDGPHINV